MALTDLRDVGLPTSLTKTKLIELLQQKYPDKVWEPLLLLRGKYAQQKRLQKVVAQLFPVTPTLVFANKQKLTLPSSPPPPKQKTGHRVITEFQEGS